MRYARDPATRRDGAPTGPAAPPAVASFAASPGPAEAPRAGVEPDRGEVTRRGPPSVPPRRQDRDLDHRIADPTADRHELEVDQVVLAGQGEQLLEAAREEFRRSVDVPEGEVEEHPTLEVVEEGAQPAAKAFPDLPVGLDDGIGKGQGIEDHQGEVLRAGSGRVGVAERLSAGLGEARAHRAAPPRRPEPHDPPRRPLAGHGTTDLHRAVPAAIRDQERLVPDADPAERRLEAP